MKNKKGLLISIISVIIVGIAGIFLAQKIQDDNTEVFDKNGYVIKVNDQAESQRYVFKQGTKYKDKFPNQLSFNDTTGNKIEVDKESYVHYNDNSVSALTDGVLMNLADLNQGNAINNYRIPSDMVVEKSGSAYQIETMKGTMKIEEGIWKLSDTRFLLFSDSIDLVFDENDIRNASTFMEINYIDEGVIQLITDENVWQTVSTSAYAKTKSGTELHLFDQLLKKEDVNMTLNKLVIQSDENIVLSPLETKNQKVPTFDIKSEDGEEGIEGEEGQEGNLGDSGSIGTNGGKGTSGTTGNNGQSGTDANQDSSMKTAIPSFSIEDWKVDAISVKGTMKITDENVMLSDENASILIYEAGSGDYISALNEDGEEGFNVQGDQVSFHSDATQTPLKPDTEYRLVLSAKYEMNGKKYDREFISRVFYTDSLGIFMSKTDVTTSSIGISLEKKNYSKTNKADLYLLTQEQSKKFELDDTNQYIMKTIDIDEGTTIYEETFSKDEYDTMDSNQKYVLRLVIYVDGKPYLTQQALQVSTLKKTPVISDQLYVIKNRPLNGFELYSGALQDDDHAVIEQRYEIFDADDTSPNNGNLVKSMQIEPGSGLSSTMLYLDKKVILTSHPYKFRLVTIYNDNEKIVEVVSDFSETFKMNEAQLPALSFQAENVQYDYISGKLIVSLNGSSIKVSQDAPLVINIDCEGLYAKTIKYTSAKEIEDMIFGDQLVIDINETGLKSDSVYRFRVTGHVDMKDGDGAQNMVIGNVVQATKPLTEISADWKVKQNSIYAVSQVLKFTASDGISWNNPQTAYDANSLSKINIALYKGSGNGKIFMNEITFEDTDTDPRTSSLVEDFVINGREISEVDFGYKANSLTDTVYTMRISSIYDYTGLSSYSDPCNISDYKNEYDITDKTREVIVTKANQPPALPDPTLINEQINATPILNKEAGVYGNKPNPSLLDDTIIGYRLETNYDNYAKLARNVTYYAFETNAYNTFIKNNENPIYDGKELKNTGDWVFRKELNVRATGSSIPVNVVFFGEGTDSIYNGISISYSGKAITNSSGLKSGMDRGYKYTFAYAINYNDFGAGEANKLYPYDHPNYEETIKLMNTPYILNSGAKEAPKTEPSFLIYPYESTIKNNELSMTLKYQYSDPDQTVLKNTTEFMIGNTPIGKVIDVEPKKWATVEFDKITAGMISNSQVVPRITRQLYNLNYTGTTNYKDITAIPVDMTPTFDFAKTQSLQYDVLANLDRNQISIHLRDSSGNDYLNQYNKKIAGINATFYDVDNEADKVVIPLTLNNANTAYISTSKLEKLLDKTIGVKVSLIFDNNKVGWNVKGLYALQNIAKTGANYSLGNYTVYNDQNGTLIDTSLSASGSIFSLTTDKWVNFDSIEKTQDITFTTPLRSNMPIDFKVRAGEYGIGRIYDDAATKLNYVVPKELSAHALIYDSQQNFRLTKIIPSVSMDDTYDQGLTYVIMNGVEFSGTSLIDSDANGNINVSVMMKDIVSGEIIEKVVNVKNWQASNKLKIDGLRVNTIYEMSIVANIKGVPTTLLNAKDSSVFFKTVKTKGDVGINNFKLQYKASSYEKQQIQASYNLDQISGFYLEYSILDEFDQVVMSAEDMQAAGMYHPYNVGDLYQTSMVEDFSLLLKQHALKPDIKYQFVVSAYQVVDGEVDHNQLLGMAKESITIPSPAQPITFTNMSPNYHNDTKKIDMNITFSVADNDHVIMSDYSLENGAPASYFARVFQQSGNDWKDVTEESIKYTPYKPGQNYTITINEAEPNTNYKVVIYAPIDMNRDGICDMDPDVSGSIVSINPDKFEKDKDNYNLWEDVQATPGENGISYGDVAIENPNRDPSRIAISYKNASNLNSIKKVEYSIISSDGKYSYSGNLLNENNVLFVEKQGVAGYYTLDIPIRLDAPNYYRISLNYYTYSGSNYEKTGTYSTTYLYEK